MKLFKEMFFWHGSFNRPPFLAFNLRLLVNKTRDIVLMPRNTSKNLNFLFDDMFDRETFLYVSFMNGSIDAAQSTIERL